jgi:predicted esterase YcpF (UPF0227 family)
MIVYLHGFLSSPASRKACSLASYLERHSPGVKLVVPQLPPGPNEAVHVIEHELEHRHDIALIGSSLGAYYATYFAERHGLRAALINPAVRPYELLASFPGPQKNLYTGEEFTVTREHLEQLRGLDVTRITPERYLLLLETGDEILDYREAVAKYRGAQHVVIEGGDHSFRSFEAHLPRILEFANA